MQFSPDPEVIFSILTTAGNITLTERNIAPVPNVRTDEIIPTGKGVKFGEGYIDLGSVITVISNGLKFNYLYLSQDRTFIPLLKSVPFELAPRIFTSLEVGDFAIEVLFYDRDPEEVMREKVFEKEEKYKGLYFEARDIRAEMALSNNEELSYEEAYEIYGGHPDLGLVFD